MKPISPLSLLLFLQLTSATPLPPVDCHSTSCSSMRNLLRLGRPNNPPNNPAINPANNPSNALTEPHFPPHQLHDLPDQAIDNTEATPTQLAHPDVALMSEQPLSSAYLLSLSNPHLPSEPPHRKLQLPTTEALPSMPTTALPQLREEDAQRYWQAVALRKPGDAASHHAKLCGEQRIISDRYVWMNSRMGRDYSDLFVVGIVLLFLAAVVAIEASETICDLSSTITGRRRVRRGEIYLEDDETFCIVKKPFYLQAPPPPPRYKIKTREKEPESDIETPQNSDDETEQFSYDSDAQSRV